ncbi:MAG: alkaline phosphatase family protein, partial [Firmicutes bacterium]|nr:alkaline phosphatase family protein [Bacillota bacterium]
MVERFAAEGALPNFARLLAEGAANPMVPCIPAYTPTNWATIATGAWPGTHGASNWDNHYPGDPPDKQVLSTFDGRTWRAETIWEAAERAGLKCLILAHPGAWPPRIRSGYVVAPLPIHGTSLTLIPGGEYATRPGTRRAQRIALQKAQGWEGEIDGRVLEGVLAVSAAAATGGAVTHIEDGAESPPAGERDREQDGPPVALQFQMLVLPGEKGYERVLICEGKNARRPVAELRVGEWSPWICRSVPVGGNGREGVAWREGTLRFKLLRLSEDGEDIRLVRSEVYPASGYTYPESLSAELLANVGPYFEHQALRQLTAPEEVDAAMEELEYQALWHARVARYLLDRGGWDLYYSHWHWPDTAAHHFLAGVDPASPLYNPETADRFLDILRRSYQIGDKMLGAFWEMADAGTYLVVVSDHGNVPYGVTCSLPRFLAEHGLTAFIGDPDQPRGVDWSRTRAYQHGGLQICVNLQGREPHGIVPPEEYERVQDEIIDALLDWRDPATGKRSIALALKKKDAQLIGFWGDTVGDVIFVYNSGFAWEPPAGTGSIGPLGNVVAAARHGPQVPTAETSVSSNLASFLIKGPGVKKGYRRNADQLGLMRLVDLVPTISHLLGFAPPAQSQGAVLYDLLESEEG